MVPWTYATQHPKLHFDGYNRFRTADGGESLYITMGRHFPPQNFPIAWGSEPHLIMVPLLGLRESTPDGISIGSAVFAGLMIVTDRPTDRSTDRSYYTVCNNVPHVALRCSPKYPIYVTDKRLKQTICLPQTTVSTSDRDRPKASDTLESFLSKVAFESDFRAFESDFRKKTCTCVMKTFAIFLLSKEPFTIRTCSILESFFRKLLSKATFERKLSSVSLP